MKPEAETSPDWFTTWISPLPDPKTAKLDVETSRGAAAASTPVAVTPMPFAAFRNNVAAVTLFATAGESFASRMAPLSLASVTMAPGALMELTRRSPFVTSKA